jgi:hypothetical protein
VFGDLGHCRDNIGAYQEACSNRLHASLLVGWVDKEREDRILTIAGFLRPPCSTELG